MLNALVELTLFPEGWRVSQPDESDAGFRELAFLNKADGWTQELAERVRDLLNRSWRR